MLNSMRRLSLKKILKVAFSRMILVGALLAIQALILIMALYYLRNQFAYVYGIFILVSLGVNLWIMCKPGNPSAKLPWVIIIAFLPFFGAAFYFIFGRTRISKRFRTVMISTSACLKNRVPDSAKAEDALAKQSIHAAVQSHYIKSTTGLPVYKNTKTEFFPTGEEAFERIKEELEKAEKFIFLEYFIIQEGKMWDPILEILKKKTAAGVDVRLLYDDVGSLNTLPFMYDKKLESMGIKCAIFNPFIPVLHTGLQNRDHRKILIIDGKVAFTGGINLADEYINEVNLHGHWKDCAISLKGDGVYSFTLMFLQIWEFYKGITFKPVPPQISSGDESNGFVQPYYDSPMDDELVGESVYLNMINGATKSLYMVSPYFIVDNELLNALHLAVKRGVDVRIITPHNGDKWYVHMITRSYYPELIRSGVQVYEYTPGFIHSKLFVVDGEFATVGSVNLDYRSLYHHFECGVWLYKTQAVEQIKSDFFATLKKSEKISLNQFLEIPMRRRVLMVLIKFFSPLM